jgi:hypothetical protein
MLVILYMFFFQLYLIPPEDGLTEPKHEGEYTV